jgi:hypothetical protein
MAKGEMLQGVPMQNIRAQPTHQRNGRQKKNLDQPRGLPGTAKRPEPPIRASGAAQAQSASQQRAGEIASLLPLVDWGEINAPFGAHHGSNSETPHWRPGPSVGQDLILIDRPPRGSPRAASIHLPSRARRASIRPLTGEGILQQGEEAAADARGFSFLNLKQVPWWAGGGSLLVAAGRFRRSHHGTAT